MATVFILGFQPGGKSKGGADLNLRSRGGATPIQGGGGGAKSALALRARGGIQALGGSRSESQIQGGSLTPCPPSPAAGGGGGGGAHKH